MALSLPGRVQIAGVIDRAEAEMIIGAGVKMLGFPLGLRVGHEDLDVDSAAEIVRECASRATFVCITYLDTAAEIARLCKRLDTNWVQLHGPVEVEEIRKLRSENSALRVIKSLIVSPGTEARLFGQAETYEPHVDAFITDTFDPQSGRSGATGKTHNWAISREIVSSTQKPVILAGGLTPENVSEAIAAVRPAAVDAHTGVEGRDGRKGSNLVTAFVNAAEAAFSAQPPGSGSYAPESYSRRDVAGTDWLAFRDLRDLLGRHLGSDAGALPTLDLGCGAGRSTRFLASLGLGVTGCDIDPGMLSLARRQQSDVEFVHLRDESLPWNEAHFGLVFCSFVLMEIDSRQRMRRLLEEVRRVLHPEGRAIFVVNTRDFYSGRWVSCDVDFEVNREDLRSGQRVCVRLVPEDIRIEDYFWTDEDYRSVFQRAGLAVLERFLPLGLPNDGPAWQDERRSAPYAIYVTGHRLT